MEIPDLGIEYEFNQFEIEKKEIAENIIIENGSIIDFSNLSGIFSDGYVSEYGYLPIEGRVNININDFSVFSLNNNCEVINKENYDKFLDKEELYGPLYEEDKKNSYKVDDEIVLSYNYFFDCNVVDIDKSDAIVANLVIQAIDEKGNKHWECVYQPSVISGRYLILPLLHNEID